ncbi:MAG: UbiA family prenyltransferase [Bacteroidetes bacterium]|nr:UbiA family prenyltransferase [Bacteroidota bacterium]
MALWFSLVRFSHTVFALPFAITGFFMAVYYGHQPFSIKIIILVLLCMVFARSAAMGFNRYADRNIDRANPRTSSRELPSGKLSPFAVILFVAANSLFFIACTYFINPLCFYLSPVALSLILLYSYTKRFTVLCHMILGLSLSLSPLGSYISLTGSFDHILPFCFSLIVLLWVSGFDIIYALPDEEFDRTNRIFSIPELFGRRMALVISAILHTVCSIVIILTGITGNFGYLYYTGSILFIFLLLRQHRMLSPADISKVNIAFANTNGLASILFAIFVCMDMAINR